MRYKRPDGKNALSMLDAAERDMAYTLTLAVTPDSCPTIARNIHECFRMLGDALLAARGAEAVDHTESIQALLALPVSTDRPLNLLDNLRRLRNNINYYGYRPTPAEVLDALEIAKSLFSPLAKAIRKTIK